MKLKTVLVVCFAMFVSYTFADTPVEYHGKLRIEGSKILNKRGEEISLSGPSLFWSNTYWGGDKFYNDDVISWIAEDWEAPIVRASMGVDADWGYLADSKNKDRIKAVIDAAINEGIYVIVDWHSHHAEDYKREAMAFFSEIASEYGHLPNILYEIYNEPLDISWTAAIKPYAEAVIGAIRSEDADNIIIVGTPNWSQDIDQAVASPIRGQVNIAYAVHFYAGTHTQWLRDKTEFAINNGICVVITEWGTVNANGDGDVATDEVALWIAFMKKHKITNCVWALNDKSEGASMLKPGASQYGYWDESDYTESGLLVYDYILNDEGNWVGVKDVPELAQNIYKNTAGDLVVSNENNIFSYSIINMQGRIITTAVAIDNIIPINSLEKGMYALKIDLNGKELSYKFIK